MTTEPLKAECPETPHIPYASLRKFTDTEKWCNSCKQMLPFARFGANKSRLSGRDLYCRECKAARKQLMKSKIVLHARTITAAPGYTGIHEWIKRRLPKPEACQDCRTVPPRDLANISQEYKRDISDWEWLCRRCHMTKDGRLAAFKEAARQRLVRKAAENV